MISCYFGVPGAGKTTLLSMFAVKELKRIKRKRSKYKRVYTNFECKGCYKMTFADLDKYKFEDCLILLDELMLDADNRGFKTFPLGVRDFLTLHRHVGVDIIYATQAYDKIDSKIRALTYDLWYMTKTVVPIFSEFTFCKRIYRRIVINEYSGELIFGYRFCNFLEMLFATNVKFVFRRLYYRYFDSFEEGVLALRPVFESTLWSEPYSFKSDLIKRMNEWECRINGIKERIVKGDVVTRETLDESRIDDNEVKEE